MHLCVWFLDNSRSLLSFDIQYIMFLSCEMVLKQDQLCKQKAKLCTGFKLQHLNASFSPFINSICGMHLFGLWPREVEVQPFPSTQWSNPNTTCYSWNIGNGKGCKTCDCRFGYYLIQEIGDLGNWHELFQEENSIRLFETQNVNIMYSLVWSQAGEWKNLLFKIKPALLSPLVVAVRFPICFVGEQC